MVSTDLRAGAAEGGSVLSERQRRTLRALCHRIVPSPLDGSADGEALDLVAEVERRLAAGDPVTKKRLAAILTALDNPGVGLLTSGRARRFTRLGPDEQDAVLKGWEESWLPARRTVFQALRRLIFSTYYSRPASHRGIGYRGPLHGRGLQLPWEGPLPGEQSDAEPVARIPLEEWPAREVDPDRSSPEERAARGRTDHVPAGITQGRDLSSETKLRAGVCVIGTGAGGAVAAARLSRAGHDVVLLEEGGYYTAGDFTEEEGPMTARLYAEAGMRGTDDLSVAVFQGRSVGGGTTVNWMIMLRTPPWVLEEWEFEHGVYGMGPKEMAPVFDEIEQETHTRTVPDDAHSPNNRIILDGARRLGWSVYSGRINASGCVRAGFCGFGCRYNAKQSMLLNYLPRALEAGARLLSDVRVEKIEVAERGGPAPLKRVLGTVLDRDTGRARGRVVVEAPIVVTSAGAVGTPALLQRSGLASRGTGRYLRFHPTSMVLGRYDDEIYAGAGIPLSAVCDEFVKNDEAGYGFWIECPPLHPSLLSIALPGFGEAHRRTMALLPNMGILISLVRDGADRGLSNGAVSTDRKGRTRIRYRLGPRDRSHTIAGLLAAARLHLAAGAREALTLHTGDCRVRSERDLGLIERQGYGPNQFGLFTAHVNGACRVGKDPATSGCTPDGEVHGVPGLYVADGSLLPTAPGVNPQETIMALSSVLSRRIAERHPSG
jgi:choline dehydrogenase-like flavoprotein